MMPAPPKTSRFPGWLLLLGALTALGPLSIDMYLPGFPAIARSLGTDGGQVQLTLASYFIGLSLGQLAYGPLSDRFGRRRPLLWGLLLYLAASIGCALSQSVESLIAWRFIQAVGGCAGIVITRAIVRDRCAPSEAARAFSLLMLVVGLAPILAPLLGGWVIAVASWHAIFIILALAGLATLLAVWRQLDETLTTPLPSLSPQLVLGGYWQLLCNRHFMTQSLAGGLAMSGMFAYIAGSPHVLIELYQVAPGHYGWIFGANALGLIAASQVNARLLRHHSLHGLLRAAMNLPPLAGLWLLGSSLLPQAPLWMPLVGFFIFVASLGFINPNSSALALAPHGKQAGMASALLGSLQFLLATLAGLALGLWHEASLTPLAAMMTLSGVSAWIMLRLVPGGSPQGNARGG